MASLAWTLFVAVVLAARTESVPLPDAGDLVVTTIETPQSVSPDATSPSSELASTTSVSQDNKPQIYSMHVTSDIEFRFAKTLVTSRVANPANESQEVSFSVVLPQDAFITGFVMEIDGKSYRAYVKEKEEAKKTYDDAIQHGQAAAHVAYSARESNSFDVSVNIEPLKKVTFNLTYEELLKRSKGLYHHVVTISPGQIVKDMSVKVHIKEPRNITKLYIPKFSSENKVRDNDEDLCSGESTNTSSCTSGNEIARKKVLSPTEAIVEFGPTLEEQKKLAQDKGKGLSGQFEVMYDVQRDPSGGEVLVKDGYFVHFFAPTDLPILPKHIVFVLDVSGSMMGRKMDQVKDAMKTILESLQRDDFFNVIMFSSQVTSWDLNHPEADLVTDRDPYYYSPYLDGTTTTPHAPVLREAVPAYPATKNYIEKALKRINETEANGGTNIFGGLKQAIKTIKGHRELLQKNGDMKARKSIVMFLTDGEANVGESRPDYIISGLSEMNTAPQAPIYSLTFGEDGNIDFLTKLSLANSGLARVIYEGADADIQLRRFYNDISSPLLSDVTFTYLPKEVDLGSTTKIHYHTYYQGGELVVAGRTADKEIQAISGDITAAAKGSDKTQYPIKTLPFEGPLVTLLDYVILPPPQEKVKERPTSSLERAWAYLTVKQLIEEYEAENSKKHKTPDTMQPSPFPAPGPPSPDSSTTDSAATEATKTTTTPKPEKINSTEKASAKQRALDLALKPNATNATTEAKRIVSGDSGGPPLSFAGFPAVAYGALPTGLARPSVSLFSSSYSSTAGAPGMGFGTGGSAFNPNSPGSGSSGHVLFLSPALSSRPSLHSYDTSRIIGGSGFAGGAAAPSAWAHNSFILSGVPPASRFALPSPTFTYAGFGGGFPGAAMAPPVYPLAGGFHASQALRPLPPPPPPAATALSSSGSGIPKRKLSLMPLVANDIVPLSVDRVDSVVLAESLDAYPVQYPSTPASTESALTTIAPAVTEPAVDPQPASNTSENITTIAPGQEEPPVQDPLDKLTLGDVKWLTPETLTNGTVEIEVKGQKKQFIVSSAVDSATATNCTAPGISSGKCRHLSQCVLRAVTSSIEAYLPFQCQLENYLAVCCVD